MASLQSQTNVTQPSVDQSLQQLQKKVLAQSGAFAGAMAGAEGKSGAARVLPWILRSTFLDASIARQAAADQAGTGLAIAVLAVTAIPSVIFGTLFSPLAFPGGLVAKVVALTLVAVVTLLLTYGTLSLLSPRLLEQKLSAAQLVRMLAYPQVICALGTIPILGGFIGPLARMWSIVACAVAAREVTGTRIERAILFAAAGALVQATSWMVLSVVAARVILLLKRM